MTHEQPKPPAMAVCREWPPGTDEAGYKKARPGRGGQEGRYIVVTILLLVALGIAIVQWLKNWIGLLTLTYYLETRHYDPPTEAEIELCSRLVIRQLFHKY